MRKTPTSIACASRSTIKMKTPWPASMDVPSTANAYALGRTANHYLEYTEAYFLDWGFAALDWDIRLAALKKKLEESPLREEFIHYYLTRLLTQ